MPVASLRMVLIGTVLFCLAPLRLAAAQSYDFEGFAELRGGTPSSQTSWRDGGLGKLEFGGHSPGGVADGAIDGQLALGAGFDALATLRAGTDQKSALDVIEAYLRYAPAGTGPWRWTTKLGAFFPPISLENEAVGWTSPWTITPSAINSWVGEELRTVGGETNLEWRSGARALSVTGAVFGWNDPAGALLADRGWAFDSRPAGLFGNVRLPGALAQSIFHKGSLTDEPFHEVDDQPGWYAALTARQDGVGRVTVLRYENRDNPALARQGQAAWRTEFTSAGAEADIGEIVLLAQAMAGFTEIAPFPGFNSTTYFQSAYVLAGRYFGDFRAALRADLFATEENHPGGGVESSEHGRALTVSGGWKPRHWLLLQAEAIDVFSVRAQRVIVGRPAMANQFQFQLAARLFF